MDAMPLDPLTIISAIVAIFVLWKLKSVLGERTGLEKPPTNPFADRPSKQIAAADPALARTDKVVRLPGAAFAPPPEVARWMPYAEPGTPLAAGLDAIAAADVTFSAPQFIEGAKIAYEAVITAFAAGERKMLQSLLAKDVYETFATALEDRVRRGETLTTTFVSMDSVKLQTAGLDGRTARIAVRFVSKQISATRSKDGSLTDGSPDQVVDMDDIWTFAREANSRDPNWKLVATQSGH